MEGLDNKKVANPSIKIGNFGYRKGQKESKYDITAKDSDVMTFEKLVKLAAITQHKKKSK